MPARVGLPRTADQHADLRAGRGVARPDGQRPRSHAVHHPRVQTVWDGRRAAGPHALRPGDIGGRGGVGAALAQHTGAARWRGCDDRTQHHQQQLCSVYRARAYRLRILNESFFQNQDLGKCILEI